MKQLILDYLLSLAIRAGLPPRDTIIDMIQPDWHDGPPIFVRIAVGRYVSHKSIFEFMGPEIDTVFFRWIDPIRAICAPVGDEKL